MSELNSAANHHQERRQVRRRHQADDAGHHPEADARGVVGSDEHGAVDGEGECRGTADVNEDRHNPALDSLDLHRLLLLRGFPVCLPRA
jgi:hypothetical protein